MRSSPCPAILVEAQEPPLNLQYLANKVSIKIRGLNTNVLTTRICAFTSECLTNRFWLLKLFCWNTKKKKQKQIFVLLLLNWCIYKMYFNLLKKIKQNRYVIDVFGFWWMKKHFGVSRQILSDRGKSFTSHEFKKKSFVKTRSMTHYLNAGGLRQENWQVKLYNRIIISSLPTTMGADLNDDSWNENIYPTSYEWYHKPSEWYLSKWVIDGYPS